jgi:hypothetical protein
MSYVWYLLGYIDEIEPDPKSVRIRHEMMKQIKNSSMLLKKTKMEVKTAINVGKITNKQQTEDYLFIMPTLERSEHYTLPKITTMNNPKNIIIDDEIVESKIPILKTIITKTVFAKNIIVKNPIIKKNIVKNPIVKNNIVKNNITKNNIVKNNITKKQR